MGPGSEGRIKLAKEVATGELVTLDEWIIQNDFGGIAAGSL